MSKGSCRWRAYFDSWLLASDSCFSINEGASGDVVENKRERLEFGVWSPESQNIFRRQVILAPDSMLLTPVLQEM